VTSKELSKILKSLADPILAEHSQQFFKTGKVEYAEVDQFLGIRVPVLRKQVKKFKDLPLSEIKDLLRSVYHEERLCALLLLVVQFGKVNEANQSEIYKLYLSNIIYINNWDLVDSSAYHIIGAYLYNKNKSPLYKLAKSKSLWERRIAIISTFYFIKNNQFDDTLEIAKQLLKDKEDLIYKAVGRMLREVGDRNLAAEKKFLMNCYRKMPRTMLLYAIKKFPEQERKKYLRGTI
jgi:3-methyladenine DNA glycosylase AlkD